VNKSKFLAAQGFLLTLLGTVAMQSSLDAAAAEVIPVEKQKFEFTTFEDKPGLRVVVERPRVLKLGGANGLMGYRWVLEEGVYRDPRQVRIAGREYVMLPVRTISMDGGRPRGSGSMGSSIGACYTADGEFIALDVETGNVLKRGFLRNKVAAHCGGGTRMDWSYSVGSIVDDGEVKIAWGQDLVDAKTRQAEFKATSAAVAEQASDALTISQKRKIGARICRIEGSIRYVGFTEGVSPDNGKIQIRVSDARYVGSERSSPSGFQPSIIWDGPDQWDLCE